MAAAGTRSGASLTASDALLSAPSGSFSTRGEKDGAMAPRRRLVEKPERGAPLDGFEGSAPVPLGAARLQDRVARPGGGRREAHGLKGILVGGRGIAPAAGFDEEAAQAENPGLVLVHHLREGGLGRGPVAGHLGRLRLEEERQGLLAEQPLGLVGIAPGRDGVARAHRHHAAGHGLVAAGAAAPATRR